MEFVLKSFSTTLSVTGIANVHFFEFPKGFRTRENSHPFCELVYVAKGQLEIKSDTYCGILPKNHLIIHGCSEMHSLICDEESNPTVIIIGFSQEGGDISSFSRTPVLLSEDQTRKLSEIVKEGRNVFLPPYNVPVYDMRKRSHQPYGSEQLLKNYLEGFLISLIRQRQGQKGRAEAKHPEKINLNEVTAYLDANYREKILIDELAFLFQTNRSTLCREFREKTGTTVGGYLNRRKIQEAGNLLLRSDLSITAISEQLNFESIHYFTKFFTKETGLTPSEYRAAGKESGSSEKQRKNG